jgi:hypothetical protein
MAAPFPGPLLFAPDGQSTSVVERAPSILERCTLLDLSKSGAKLSISDIYDLPESFALRLIKESVEPRICQVIWRRDHLIRGEFVRSTPGGTLTKFGPSWHCYFC